ncbi:hypothetical protein B0H14DRAFT_3730571 [Mycena olivaceomarginata]|nr:hypothetical protein B0H14DRAFT_3730571 [Mycena olivaceomarginata]
MLLISNLFTLLTFVAFFSSATPSMPEKGVIRLFLREIKWDEYELLKKKIHRDHQDDDEYFSGCFVTHPKCCAWVSGNRQTFTIHVTPPNDPNLEPLLHPRPAAPPKKKGKGMKPTANTAALQPRFYCSTCHTSADVEEEEDDNDLGGTEITSVNPFPKPIGSNWFQYIMGPMGVKFGGSSHIQREGPQQLREVCGLSHIANLDFPLLMWEFPEGHITGTKQIAILHAIYAHTGLQIACRAQLGLQLGPQG